MASSGRSRAGTRFGKYELLTLLGRGGMGEVYEARDTEKGRLVALKILLDQYAQDPVYRSRFTREANAAAALQEPHVVPIHDWGEIDGNLFIDMRLVRGTDLRKLTERGPLDPGRAVHIIGQVAAGLDAAHAEGLIHRDVKPENIVVSGDDFAHLLDFGIAEKAGDTRLTQAGMTIGSWAYMAPERLSGDDTTTSVDIYSLACVLYEALTGARPFAIDSMQQVINAHLNAPPPRASAANPRISPALDAVIERGMAKEPDDRYGSAGALARAAQRALSAPADHDLNATMAGLHANAPTTQHTCPAPIAPAAAEPPPPARGASSGRHAETDVDRDRNVRGTVPCGRRDRCRLVRRPVRKRRQRHFSAEPLVDPTADARPTPHRTAALNTRPEATAASTGGPATGSNGHRRTRATLRQRLRSHRKSRRRKPRSPRKHRDQLPLRRQRTDCVLGRRRSECITAHDLRRGRRPLQSTSHSLQRQPLHPRLQPIPCRRLGDLPRRSECRCSHLLVKGLSHSFVP